MPRHGQQERPDETAARSIVRHALRDATVTWHDKGISDSMVDALITYRNGRQAALETVGDHDEAYLRVLARVTREGQVLTGPGLKYSWRITVEDNAPIRELREQIVALLEFIEAEPTPRELAWPNGARWNEANRVNHALKILGVKYAQPDWSRGSSPKVIISARVLIGLEGDPNALPVWAVQFLTNTAPDVPRKLAASGYPERHAFIWATFTTSYEIASILDGDTLPTEAPELPDGVTHLWVGGWYRGSRTLAWHLEDGWSEAYRIPADGRLDL